MPSPTISDIFHRHDPIAVDPNEILNNTNEEPVAVDGISVIGGGSAAVEGVPDGNLPEDAAPNVPADNTNNWVPPTDQGTNPAHTNNNAPTMPADAPTDTPAIESAAPNRAPAEVATGDAGNSDAAAAQATRPNPATESRSTETVAGNDSGPPHTVTRPTAPNPLEPDQPGPSTGEASRAPAEVAPPTTTNQPQPATTLAAGMAGGPTTTTLGAADTANTTPIALQPTNERFKAYIGASVGAVAGVPDRGGEPAGTTDTPPRAATESLVPNVPGRRSSTMYWLLALITALILIPGHQVYLFWKQRKNTLL